MRTPTLEQFQAWSKAHHDLAMTVCEAMAFAQTKREQVDAYVLPIFKKYRFRVSPDWRQSLNETIKSPKDLYLTDEESKVQRFYRECDKEHRAHGFDGPAGNCPALVAEHLLIRAENLLLDAGCELLGLEHPPYDLEKRQKMIDLLLGACLKSENEEKQAA